MSRFLERFGSETDAAALGTVASAFQIVFPHIHSEREFTYARREIVPLWSELDWRAKSQSDRLLELPGREQTEPLLATLGWVHRTRLFPSVPGFRARQYLASFLVESVASPHALPEGDLLILATTIRSELKALNHNRTSRSPIPDPGSILELIAWFDKQSQSSERFSKNFWSMWQRSLRSFAERTVLRPADASISQEDEEATLVFGANDEQDDDVSFVPRGWLPPIDEDEFSAAAFSPGTRSTILGSHLSTATSLAVLTSASNSVLRDSEVQQEVARLIPMVDGALSDADVLRAEAALGRLVMLCTATAADKIADLRWGIETEAAPYPGTISLNSEWLYRAEIRPPNAAAGIGSPVSGIVWIPIPRTIGVRLQKMCPTARKGDPVFPGMSRSTGTSVFESSDGAGAPTIASLRRTLISRLARSEPLGLTAAQWVAGDSLGVSLAPMYYDRFEADRLAAIVERLVFPWFNELPGRARAMRASHCIGSRIAPDIRRVRTFFASLRQGEQSNNLPERIRARMKNVVHGFVAITGHRPNNALGALTLDSFGLPDPIAVIADKRVAPDWRERPVALPAIWHCEFRALLCDLSEAAGLVGASALSAHARLALAGSRPVFFEVVDGDHIRPYGAQAYCEELPPELRCTPNFARHLLNARLTGVVPEAIRVAQLGWHGAREGAFAEGSPSSVLDVAQRLEKPLSEHLKYVGWAPSTDDRKGWTERVEPPLLWLRQEAMHTSEFRTHVTLLRRQLAARHAAAALEMRPKLSEWLKARAPRLTLTHSGKLALIDAGEPYAISDARLRELELVLSGGDTRSEVHGVARNLLSALVRDARNRGVVVAAVPRRVIWDFPLHPGPFSRVQPRALRDFRRADEWLATHSNSRNKAEPESTKLLSEHALAAAAVVLHGPYSDHQQALSALAEHATLHRSRADPHVLLVNIQGTGSTPGEEGLSDSSLPDRCLAFGGLAALHLVRWHTLKRKTRYSSVELCAEVFRALPAALRPSEAGEIFPHLSALARARAALTMDGTARLVGTGAVNPTTVDARRVVALREGVILASKKGLVNRDVGVPAVDQHMTGAGAALSNYGSLCDAITVSMNAIAHNESSESDERTKLTNVLHAWCAAAATKVRTIDLIARFALALLMHGGRRKEHLKLRTVRDYVYAVGSPLVRHLPDYPLVKAPKAWQRAYLTIVASTAPEMRAKRSKSLQTFHWVLSQEFEIPEVDFPELQFFAGTAVRVVDAGAFTLPELGAIGTQLREDAEQLAMDDASQNDLHVAAARRVAYEIMASSNVRTGEVHGLRVADVDVASAPSVRVRRAGLKTINARRRIAFRTDRAAIAADAARVWLEDALARHGRNHRESGPLFATREANMNKIDRRDLFDRIAEIARTVTGMPAARPYWLRKTDALQELSRLLESDSDSLWPLRDFAARMGHGSVRVTLNCYIHDPVLPFERWFSAQIECLDADRMATALGRSRWSAVVRGKTRTRRASKQERMIQFLEAIAPEPLSSEPLAKAPPIRTMSTFRADLAEVDAILRVVARGVPHHYAATVHRWPDAAKNRLGDTLSTLQSHHLVSIAQDGEATVQLRPPRRIEADGGVREFFRRHTGSAVLAEMCEAWLSHAAIPGVPHGIPAAPATWSRWTEAMPGLTKLLWERRQWGGMEVRVVACPNDKTTSPWPLFRWNLLVEIVRGSMARKLVDKQAGSA